ncbi:MAG: hypothetical protein DDT40_01480 [candidate division WS2 bacterium]|nr:hypothetical protein [Candidatus Psychracetigena formicireducens]
MFDRIPTFWNNTGSADYHTFIAYERHSGGANLLFLDGHVAWDNSNPGFVLISDGGRN